MVLLAAQRFVFAALGVVSVVRIVTMHLPISQQRMQVFSRSCSRGHFAMHILIDAVIDRSAAYLRYK
jgi:hypothetical protein